MPTREQNPATPRTPGLTLYRAPAPGPFSFLLSPPAGKEEQRIYFPASLVVGIAFGGEDLRDLYVTTAGGDNKKENGPGAGALYRVRPGVRGVAGFCSRVGM